MNRNSTARAAVARRRARDRATVSTLSGNSRVSEWVRQATGYPDKQRRESNAEWSVKGNKGEKGQLTLM